MLSVPNVFGKTLQTGGAIPKAEVKKLQICKANWAFAGGQKHAY